jgi:hypothetical protein
MIEPGTIPFSEILMAAGAGMAAFSSNTRRGVIALWFSQLGAGAILLGTGAELLALAYWLSSTLVCGAYFLHSDLLGSGRGDREAGPGALRRRLAARAFPAVASVGFGLLVWALFGLALEWDPRSAAGVIGPAAAGAGDERIVLIELLSITSLALAVAAGVIVRPRRS